MNFNMLLTYYALVLRQRKESSLLSCLMAIVCWNMDLSRYLKETQTNISSPAASISNWKFGR
jgi:hypothetical protein